MTDPQPSRDAEPLPLALRGGEPVVIPTADGARLCGELLLPTGVTPRVVAALSHAMMVDRRTLDRAPRTGGGILSELLAAGVAVLWFGQRGHGQSGRTPTQGGRWDYDDLVHDAGAVATYLRTRLPGLKRVAVGHSLYGHVALAYQAHATGDAARYDGFVLLGCNVWLRTLEPSLLRWWRKRLSYQALLLLGRPLGYLPVRRLGFGTADEPYAYLAQMGGWVGGGDWTDRDGRSYLAELGNVNVPILSVVGAGDRLMAVPASQLALLARTSGPLTHWLLGKDQGDAVDPDHMGLVLDVRLRPRWRALAAWVARLGELPPS